MSFREWVAEVLVGSSLADLHDDPSYRLGVIECAMGFRPWLIARGS